MKRPGMQIYICCGLLLLQLCTSFAQVEYEADVSTLADLSGEENDAQDQTTLPTLSAHHHHNDDDDIIVDNDATSEPVTDIALDTASDADALDTAANVQPQTTTTTTTEEPVPETSTEPNKVKHEATPTPHAPTEHDTATETETEQPETKDPETKEPEPKEPETKEPEPKDPETKEPEPKDPETKEPVATNPENVDSRVQQVPNVYTQPIDPSIPGSYIGPLLPGSHPDALRPLNHLPRVPNFSPYVPPYDGVYTPYNRGLFVPGAGYAPRNPAAIGPESKPTTTPEDNKNDASNTKGPDDAPSDDANPPRYPLRPVYRFTQVALPRLPNIPYRPPYGVVRLPPIYGGPNVHPAARKDPSNEIDEDLDDGSKILPDGKPGNNPGPNDATKPIFHPHFQPPTEEKNPDADDKTNSATDLPPPRGIFLPRYPIYGGGYNRGPYGGVFSGAGAGGAGGYSFGGGGYGPYPGRGGYIRY